jgi:excisionase family DNA binding protein
MDLSVAEAAERLRCGEAEVHELLRAGRLRGEEAGGELRIDTLSVIEELGRRLSQTIERVPQAPASSGGSVWAAVLVPVGLVLLALFSLVYLMLLADGLDAVPVPPLVFAVGFVGVLGGLAALARSEGSLHTFNGIGVQLLGRRQTPRGVVGTSWLTAFMVPLVPLRSYLVHAEQELAPEIGSRTTQFQLEALEGLCWPQVLPVWIGVWAVLVAGGWWMVAG